MTLAIPQPSSNKSKLTRGVIKTVAGMAVTNREDFLRLVVHSGQLMIQKQFSQALHDSYSFFVKNGEIKAEYFDSTSFGDLAPEFATVSESSFSVYKLNQIRKIFVNLAKDHDDGSHLKHLLDVALELSETEIKVLLADFAYIELLPTERPASGIGYASEWAQAIAGISGLKHSELVILASDGLINKRLMTPYQYPDQSGVACDLGMSRLTTLGMGLCSLLFLENDPFEEGPLTI